MGLWSSPQPFCTRVRYPPKVSKLQFGVCTLLGWSPTAKYSFFQRFFYNVCMGGGFNRWIMVLSSEPGRLFVLFVTLVELCGACGTTNGRPIFVISLQWATNIAPNTWNRIPLKFDGSRREPTSFQRFCEAWWRHVSLKRPFSLPTVQPEATGRCDADTASHPIPNRIRFCLFLKTKHYLDANQCSRRRKEPFTVPGECSPPAESVQKPP